MIERRRYAESSGSQGLGPECVRCQQVTRRARRTAIGGHRQAHSDQLMRAGRIHSFRLLAGTLVA